jgi:carbonic anhydrase
LVPFLWRYPAFGRKNPEQFATEAFGDLEGDVRQSIARIKASPFIPRKDAIREFVYGVETGRLREVS